MHFTAIFSVFTVLVSAAQGIEERGDYRLVTLRTHSLNKPYLDQDFQSRWWDYGGTTVIDAANHVRLTVRLHSAKDTYDSMTDNILQDIYGHDSL